MRAKVAKHAHGHPFEKRFMDLTPLQLWISYKQAIRDEKEDMDLIKTISKAWEGKFDGLFEVLYAYTNPRAFDQYTKTKELEKHREEIDPDEFLEYFDELLEEIPEILYTEEAPQDDFAAIPQADEETYRTITSLKPYKPRKKEGE